MQLHIQYVYLKTHTETNSGSWISGFAGWEKPSYLLALADKMAVLPHLLRAKLSWLLLSSAL